MRHAIDVDGYKKMVVNLNKISFFFWLIINNILWKFRIIFFKLLFYKYFEISNLLKNFSKDGFYIKKNLFTDEEIDFLNQKCEEELSKFNSEAYLKDNMNRIEKKPGAIKIKHINKTNTFIANFVKIKIFHILNLIINFRLAEPSIIYNVTHDGSINNELFSGYSENQLAWEVHIDGYKHDLKALIALEDITLENGPTAILPKSNFKLKLFNNYFNIFYLKKYKFKLGPTTIISSTKNNMNKYEKITLKKGSCLFFDSRSLHYASSLKKGIRKILWLYF